MVYLPTNASVSWTVNIRQRWVSKGGGQVVIAPNPASSGTVTLSAAPVNRSPKIISDAAERPAPASAAPALQPTIRQIKIYDVTGKLRKAVINQSGSLPLQLDASDLNNGVYFVEMLPGKDIDRQKLVIQH